MATPIRVSEVSGWPNAREIAYFIGVNGAGKTTLANRLAARCEGHGGKVIRDLEQRAFDRRFMGRSDLSTHREIVAHCRSLIDEWKSSDANLVVVDRWYETYITECNLPRKAVEAIEAALRDSGFAVTLIHLTIGTGALNDDFAVMFNRLSHTKKHRPAEWWDPSRGSLEERARRDCEYQQQNRAFCRRVGAEFAATTRCTTAMDWDAYEQSIAAFLVRGWMWRGMDNAGGRQSGFGPDG